MPEPKYLPELEIQVRMAMDVPEPSAKAMDALREQFIAQGMSTLKPDLQPDSATNPSQPEKETKMKPTSLRFVPRLAWGMAFIVVAILLTLVLTSPTVVNALRRLLGYIPGVGFVEGESSLRILDKSITVERENISLTVEQVVASAEKTIIIYQYFAPVTDFSKFLDPMDTSPGNPALILPDGSKVEVRFGRRMKGDGLPTDKGAYIRYSLEFPPFEAAVTDVTLELPGLPGVLPSADPKDWQIPLKLIPAPEGFVIPVFEVEENGMSGESVSGTAPSPKSLSEDTNVFHGITTSVDLYIPLEDGYLLIGSMQWSEKDYPAYGVKPLDYINVTDATGGEIPFEPVLGPVPEKPQDEMYRSYWAIKVMEKNFVAPLRIGIDSASVNLRAPFVFQFDPGSSPAPGQSWEINRDFQIGDIQARILKANLTTRGSPVLVFEFVTQAQPNELADVYIGMEINQCMGGGGNIPTVPYEIIWSSVFTCRTDLPPGPLEAQVTGAVVWGSWQVEWSPPETAVPESATPNTSFPTHAEACLTGETWQQALGKNEPIPSNLTGTMVLANPQGEISMVTLASGKLKVIGNGDMPSLSPDGSLVAITGPIVNFQPPNGLYVIDSSSGNPMLLPGTAAGDNSPLWSPDGMKIAFTRGPAGSIGAPGPYQVMVMNADGSNLRQLTSDYEEKLATAWMPDSVHIIYIVRHGLKSASVQMVDVGTGEISQLFEINYGYGAVVISPDGQQAAYEDWLPGEIYALFVSNLDGSNRSLLAQGSAVTVVTPKWSPDGQWIIASVFDDNSDSKLALIHADTCQIIPLRNLTGYVGSWIP